MRCPGCGSELADNVQSCSVCGRHLTNPEIAAQFAPDEGAELGSRAHAAQSQSNQGQVVAAPTSPTPHDTSPYGGVPPMPGLHPSSSGWLPPPARPSTSGRIVGLIILVVLLLAVAGGVAHLMLQPQQPLTIISAPPTGTGNAATASAYAATANAEAATAEATASALLVDPMTSPIYAWPQDAHCKFESASSYGYHDIGPYICQAPIGAMADASVQVQAALVAGPQTAFGLVFRQADTTDYYFFGISYRGYWSFQKIAHNTQAYVIGWTANSAILRGYNQPNTLKVVMHGSQFDFYVNEVHVGSATDGSIPKGLVGVSSAGGGPASDVMFTNFYMGRELQ